MTCRTPFGTFLGAGFDFLVAAGALRVECIRPFGNIRVFTFYPMTLDAAGCLGFTDFQGVVTIAAGKTVAKRAGVRFVIEEDIAGNTVKHQADRLCRRFGGKGGIADCTDKKQDNSH